MIFSRFVLPLLAATACAPHYARSPSWEPTSPLVLATRDRASASLYLDQSLRLWDRWHRWKTRPVTASDELIRWRPGRYSYIRGYEASPNRVDFTVIAVNEGKVTVRALFRADPQRLTRSGSLGWHKQVYWPIWVERGAEVGSHDEGAKAFTVEALYEQCRRQIIRADTAASPRLYFHPNGLLMHCGYLSGECADCESVSLHSLTIYPVDEIFPLRDASRWACDSWLGPILPWADFPLRSEGSCEPPPQPTPRRRIRAGPPKDDELLDICDVDSRACPQLPCTGLEALGMPKDSVVDAKYGFTCRRCDSDCFQAQWIEPVGPTPCPGTIAWPARAATFSDLGKPAPLMRWAFPFRMRRDHPVCGSDEWTTEQVRQPVLR